MTWREPSRNGDQRNIRHNQKEVTQTKDQLITISNGNQFEVDEMDRRRKGEGFQGLAEFAFFNT